MTQIKNLNDVNDSLKKERSNLIFDAACAALRKMDLTGDAYKLYVKQAVQVGIALVDELQLEQNKKSSDEPVELKKSIIYIELLRSLESEKWIPGPGIFSVKDGEPLKSSEESFKYGYRTAITDAISRIAEMEMGC